jgi:nucleotide-binding universal stress UspA family protein
MSVAVAHQPSPTSTLALREAAAEAQMRGTSLAVIHVVETLDLDKVEALRAGLNDEIDKALAASGNEHVDWALYPATAESSVADAVLGLAVEAGAELLVIGARRRSPVGKFLLGSLTQTIILQAAMPVMVVKD